MAVRSFKKQMLGLFLAVGAISVLFGLWTFYNTHDHNQRQFKLANGYLLPNPQALQPFKLTTDTGQSFNLQSMKGRWSFVFFGFSHCQKICPATLARLSKMDETLKQAGANPMPQVVFVSIDPDRDTAQRLHRYLKSFNERFVGLTGEQQKIKQFIKQFNVLYTKVQQANGEYTLDHSGTLMLVDPQGKLAAMFRQPLDPQALAGDYMRIIQHYTRHVHKHSIVSRS
jgi:protein SCO1/2